jgi:miniconductance mechanosensitive channel
MIQSIELYLKEFGLQEKWTLLLANAAVIILVLLVSVFAYWFVKKVLFQVVGAYTKLSKNKWDDILLNRRLFARVAGLAPAIIIHMAAPAFPGIQAWIQRLAFSYIILMTILVSFTLLDGFEAIYQTFEISREKPLKGLLQIVKIALFVVGTIFVIATLLDRSPWALLSGIGVFSAVLLLIFQNSILGFVAGVQLAGNDMVRVGDWIEMPKYNADGDVIDITLHTIKVQNWDKTITMIPANAMITDSFKNWRGMKDAGGRRIKRSIYIDMNSIKFCTEEMLERFEQFHYLTDYIRYKRKEIEEYNKETGVNPEQLVNGRRMTNIGTFRAYVQNYLKNHPALNKDMLLLVRQLAPGEFGLPIEIYCFTRSTVWTEYESVQADIFDHILAIVPQFDLQIFQSPSGKDIKDMKSTL